MGVSNTGIRLGAGESHLHSQEAFEAIADWVSSLHGPGEIATALARLARLFRASGATLIRHKNGAFRQVVGARLTDHRCICAGGNSSEVFDDDFANLQPGAVWMLSEAQRDASFVETQWLHERAQSTGNADLSMVVLGSTETCFDFCEFRFVEEVTRKEGARLRAMAPAMATAWSGRLPGTVQGLLAQRRREARDCKGSTKIGNILTSSNPAGLSRSEYRICVLIREGLVAKSIADDLQVCESTVRSHLRSIYAKTGSSGHVDLLFRLTRPDDELAAPARLSA